MIECEGIGKNVEKAIEDALFKLKACRDDVDIKILETGGIFKKAKVIVTISSDAIEKYEKIKKLREKEIKEEKIFIAKEETIPQTENKKLEENKIINVQLKKEVEKPEQKNKEIINETEQNSIEGKDFLEGLLKILSIKGEVKELEKEDEVFYNLIGEEVSSLIGYRGESLNSLQFLLSVINGKNRKNKKVRLDIDGYREKREETLIALAKRVAKKVEKTGHQTKLEPMSAYERRVIHSTISQFEGLVSISKGEEPFRYLIIKKA